MDTKHLMQILDAKYEKADLSAIVEYDCMHLSAPDQSSLLELLQDFEELFDETLGDWDCKTVSLQLKEWAQPYHGHPDSNTQEELVNNQKGNQKTMWLESITMASWFWIGFVYIYNTKAGQHCMSCQQF